MALQLFQTKDAYWDLRVDTSRDESNVLTISTVTLSKDSIRKVTWAVFGGVIYGLYDYLRFYRIWRSMIARDCFTVGFVIRGLCYIYGS